MKHLVIPDEHYFPGDNLRRCDSLGQFIVEHQPDVIVRIGDIWDMPSLCSYDKGKRGMVFKNVKDDLEAGHKAEKRIFAPMLKLNADLAARKKKQYTPRIVKILGNHEYRVARLLEMEPRWDGSISMDDFKTRLPIQEEIVPFLEMVEIDGVGYSHYFSSGVQGRPFSSARAMLQKTGSSLTMGHVHTLDHALLTKPNGGRIRGLFAGSFHDPDHKGFAGPQVDKAWWNGIIMKHDVNNGDYDIEEISVRRLLAEY